MKLDVLKTQVGGDHYKKLKIQPIEVIETLNLSYPLANALKYVTRYKDKNGKEDLEKAIHYLRIEHQQSNVRSIKAREFSRQFSGIQRTAIMGILTGCHSVAEKYVEELIQEEYPETEVEE